MKKHLTLSLIACMIFALAACSKSTKDTLKGSWTVSKLSMAGSPQDPELFGPFVYEFNDDGSYAYAEGTKKESGKWSVTADEKQIAFEPAAGEKYAKDIKSVSADSVVLTFKSFTMDVNQVLVPKK